jgi:mannonate dehydratase
MKLSMVAVPQTDNYLRTLKQIGIDYVVHYDMRDLPEALEDLEAIRDRYHRFGLAWTVAESGPAMDHIILGKSGAAAQIERYKRVLGNLGKVGVEVVVYNFMPQVGGDAMVVRTSFDARTRGGAKTSRFRVADLTSDTLRHTERAISREQMWGNLERFLRSVLPTAEAAGVRLALHPDDPPMSPLCGLERIMDREDSFVRLLSISSSPANALTFCVGCFAELGSDILNLIDRFRERIACVHLRNIAGTPRDFVETFPDDGDINLVAVVRKLHEIGFAGYLRSDHAPQLDTDREVVSEGYGTQGHLFAIGYLRGLVQATAPSRLRESAR